MEEKIIKLWQQCEDKRQLILSKINDESSLNNVNILKHLLIPWANSICDIMDEINDIIESKSNKDKPDNEELVTFDVVWNIWLELNKNYLIIQSVHNESYLRGYSNAMKDLKTIIKQKTGLDVS